MFLGRKQIILLKKKKSNKFKQLSDRIANFEKRKAYKPTTEHN